MPHRDFEAMVNFLLRGLQCMGNQFERQRLSQYGTYWHINDPAFRHVMGNGSNKYTQALMMQMGFVQLNDVYWIWPSVHLDGSDRMGTQGVTWGVAAVRADCPGNDEERLEEMISVLKSCQIALQEKGSDFSGHFRRKGRS